MDIFEEYIKHNKQNKACRALTCDSYKKVYEKQIHEVLDDKKTNFELATYGDALLKFALCSIFLDKEPKLSEKKKKYEEDEKLITVVAKHYDLLEYMNFDRDDADIRKEYTYDKENKKRTKFIATTVEAVLGAIYLYEHRTFEEIYKIVQSWIHLIDLSEK